MEIVWRGHFRLGEIVVVDGTRYRVDAVSADGKSVRLFPERMVVATTVRVSSPPDEEGDEEQLHRRGRMRAGWRDA